jgi:hypothetical protein
MYQGFKIFTKIEVLPQNSKRRKGDATQVPYDDTQILGATGKI